MTTKLYEKKIVCIDTKEIEVLLGEYDNNWITGDFAILWKNDKEKEIKDAMKSMLDKKYTGFWKKLKISSNTD